MFTINYLTEGNGKRSKKYAWRIFGRVCFLKRIESAINKIITNFKNMSIEKEGEEEDKINFKAEVQSPEELKALIENSEKTLPGLKGKAREMMEEAIEANKKKLEEMEGKTIETKEAGEKKGFTAEEIERIRKIVSDGKHSRWRFLRQLEESGDKELIEEARKSFEEAEEVEKNLNK